MVPAIILLSMSCAPAVMQNVTREPWTAWDRNRMAYCSKRCVVEYPDAPCLVLFRKFGRKMYTCICGIPKER